LGASLFCITIVTEPEAEEDAIRPTVNVNKTTYNFATT